MIVRSKELKNFIDNVTKFNGFLIYGPDKGKVKENANNIIKKLQSDYSFGNVKVLNEDIEKNTLLDLIFQKDIFSDKSIIKIDLDLVKSIKLDRDFFSSLISKTNNILLLEAGSLNKNDPMVKVFSIEKKLICIPCYHDSLNDLKDTIREYCREFNLTIDTDSFNYLSNKLGSDKQLTKQEIKKLSIYGKGKSVSYNDVLNSIGDSSMITINKICDSLFNNNRAPYYYEKIIEEGYNNIIVVRSLLNHFYFLLSLKKDHTENSISFPPLIHFSRHKLIKNQIRLLSVKKINKIILNIYELEKILKNQQLLGNLFIKKFLLYYSSI